MRDEDLKMIFGNSSAMQAVCGLFKGRGLNCYDFCSVVTVYIEIEKGQCYNTVGIKRKIL